MGEDIQAEDDQCSSGDRPGYPGAEWNDVAKAALNVVFVAVALLRRKVVRAFPDIRTFVAVIVVSAGDGANRRGLIIARLAYRRPQFIVIWIRLRHRWRGRAWHLSGQPSEVCSAGGR